MAPQEAVSPSAACVVQQIVFTVSSSLGGLMNML